MRRHNDRVELVTTEEAIAKLNLDALRPLAALLLAAPPTRKAELVPLLTRTLLQPNRLRELYEQLDDLGKAAVQEATHHPEGFYDSERFEAKYGDLSRFHEPAPDKKSSWYESERQKRPTLLKLFFLGRNYLPIDLRRVLLTFVPEPRPFQLTAFTEVPPTFRPTWENWDGKPETGEEVPLCVRETTREALHDVKAVLRLIETGRVRVSDKKQRPTAASLKAIAPVLQGGDFYTAEDQSDWEDDPDADLTIKAFAWPMIVQAAGLAEKKGDSLRLTPAGQKALAAPAQEVVRAAWKKWRGSKLLDEFNRVEAIKGQGKARLSDLPKRRKVVLDGLVPCPVGLWVRVDDFFRYLRGAGQEFVVAHEEFTLYLCENYYGNFGNESRYAWEQIQGRYVLALLFEYAATLGLIDVAYVNPQGARHDYRDRWGADDLSCLSRYDGLIYFRINPLGAWCLERAEEYEPPVPQSADVLRVLPNLDVVAKAPPLDAADRQLLDRFAEPQSEAVWHLTSAKVLSVVEEGGSLDELAEFLKARSAAELPQTVQVFLDDLRQRAGQLHDRGLVRLVECADAGVARQLAADPQLRGKCQLAGECGLVFRSGDETAVRRSLRRLGYILPPQAE